MAAEILRDQGVVEGVLGESLANIGIGVGVFLISLLFLFAVSSLLSGWIRASRLNALDRSLGFVAGLAAAAVLVSLVYIPLRSPLAEFASFNEARLRPVIEWGAEIVRPILPEGFLEEEEEEAATTGDGEDRAEAERTAEEFSNPRPKAAESGSESGYETRERRDLDRLFESTQDR